MADYIYRISSSGTATGANAGFTTLNAAISDFKTNDRMAAGANGRVAASTVYFRVDGFLTLGGVDLFGIDTTTNSGAAIVLESWGSPWTASTGRMGYVTTFDGVDVGGSAQFNFGTSGARQANLTVRNLVLSSSMGGYSPAVVCYGPTGGANTLLIDRCFIRSAHGTQAEGVGLDAANMRNSVVFTPNGGGDFILSAGRTTANGVDHCTFLTLGTMLRFVYNQNDPLPLVRNSYFCGNTSTFANSGTWSSSCVGNATDQASGWSGPTGTVYGVARTTTNFVNVTAGSEDLKVQPASALVAGAARLASLTTDAYGTSRADPATIGAYEYTAPAVALGGNITLDDAGVSGGFGMVASNGFGGAITLDDALPSGGFSIGVAFGGSVTLDDATPGGGFTIAPKAVTTLPISRNTGGRPTGLTGIAVAVLSDDANLTRYAGATSISQNPDGTLTFTSASLPAPGSSVLVVTRESDGKPGVWRYTVA